MEKEKNKNSRIIILVVVLCLIASGLGGYGGYILYNKETSNKEAASKNNEQNGIVKNNINIQNATQVLSTRVGDIVVSTDGSVYYVPNTKFLDYHSDGKKLSFIDSTKIGAFSKYKVDGYRLGVASDGTLSPTEFEGYKLDLSDVTAAYECYFGNGGLSDSILFTTKSGKVDIFTVYIGISTDEKAEVKIDKDISEHENIISILQSAGFDSSNVLLVDKDGNKYEFNYNYDK